MFSFVVFLFRPSSRVFRLLVLFAFYRMVVLFIIAIDYFIFFVIIFIVLKLSKYCNKLQILLTSKELAALPESKLKSIGFVFSSPVNHCVYLIFSISWLLIEQKPPCHRTSLIPHIVYRFAPKIPLQPCAASTIWLVNPHVIAVPRTVVWVGVVYFCLPSKSTFRISPLTVLALMMLMHAASGSSPPKSQHSELAEPPGRTATGILINKS